MRRNLTCITGYFEQTIFRYLPVEFKDLQTPLSNDEKTVVSQEIDHFKQTKHTLHNTAMKLLLLHNDGK